MQIGLRSTTLKAAQTQTVPGLGVYVRVGKVRGHGAIRLWVLAPARGPLGAGDTLVASMAIGVAGLVLERTAGVLGVGCNEVMVLFRVLGRKVMAQRWKEMWWWWAPEEGAAGRGGKGDLCVLWVLSHSFPCGPPLGMVSGGKLGCFTKAGSISASFLSPPPAGWRMGLGPPCAPSQPLPAADGALFGCSPPSPSPPPGALCSAHGSLPFACL